MMAVSFDFKYSSALSEIGDQLAFEGSTCLELFFFPFLDAPSKKIVWTVRLPFLDAAQSSPADRLPFLDAL